MQIQPLSSLPNVLTAGILSYLPDEDLLRRVNLLSQYFKHLLTSSEGIVIWQSRIIKQIGPEEADVFFILHHKNWMGAYIAFTQLTPLAYVKHLRERNKPEEALIQIRKFLISNPTEHENVSTLGAYAACLTAAGKPIKAEHCLSRIQKILYGDSSALQRLGLCG